jgi:hypothetical protein
MRVNPKYDEVSFPFPETLRTICPSPPREICRAMSAKFRVLSWLPGGSRVPRLTAEAEEMWVKLERSHDPGDYAPGPDTVAYETMEAASRAFSRPWYFND